MVYGNCISDTRVSSDDSTSDKVHVYARVATSASSVVLKAELKD